MESCCGTQAAVTSLHGVTVHRLEAPSVPARASSPGFWGTGGEQGRSRDATEQPWWPSHKDRADVGYDGCRGPAG